LAGPVPAPWCRATPASGSGFRRRRLELLRLRGPSTSVPPSSGFACRPAATRQSSTAFPPVRRPRLQDGQRAGGPAARRLRSPPVRLPVLPSPSPSPPLLPPSPPPLDCGAAEKPPWAAARYREDWLGAAPRFGVRERAVRIRFRGAWRSSGGCQRHKGGATAMGPAVASPCLARHGGERQRKGKRAREEADRLGPTRKWLWGVW
jgi:hypothetical protein